MVLYIHGFASSGEGLKANLFRKYYHDKKIPFLAPSLSFIPALALSTLEEIIQNCKNVKLIGSSLGGYYALYLAHKYDTKAVLINPSIDPQKTLRRVLGRNASFYDKQSGFFWDESHVQSLKRFKVEQPPLERILLLLQKGDETLDYREALTFLNGAQTILEEGGSHTFEGIECHFKRIEEFLS